MASTAKTARTAEINDPTAQATSTHASGAAHSNGSTSNSAAAEDESVAGTAKRATAEKAEAAKDAAAARAREHAERVREAGESFDPNSFAHAASERLADNLSEAAQSIRSSDIGQLTDDLAVFARRQPLLFFGGAALLGFAAGRMLKASERAEHDDDMASPYYDRRVS